MKKIMERKLNLVVRFFLASTLVGSCAVFPPLFLTCGGCFPTVWLSYWQESLLELCGFVWQIYTRVILKSKKDLLWFLYH